MSFSILGTGSCTPKRKVTNAELCKFLDTSDEWIFTRTGIKERRVLTSENLIELSKVACENAISDAGITGEEIDMIICSTVRGDFVSPSMSCIIAKDVNPTCRYFYDMNMGCCGFISALDLAVSCFKAGKVKNVLVVCAESMTRLCDWEDRSSCVLFGDAVAAVVLGVGDSMLFTKLSVYPNSEHLNIPACTGNSPYIEERITDSYLTMNGQEVYKFAVSSITKEANEALGELKLSPNDISYYLMHQANMRIVEAVRNRLNQSEEKFPCNMERYGNTSSASIPLLLDELNKSNTFNKGDKLLFGAFGAGLATGVCVLEWCK
ncbi:MAG: ketoacyl-ACP synthase III [Clostridiales bacterium]|nr:ketoacyl-ACP synthase III [Clostridiales bacterium]